ncbi:hypothetical protein [Acidomonas methanolica]|uniref:hypothetical protein n=1 Tax=Acidomonas methanolica TaxID=437 RepID=UPI00211A258E|nr:hypothetical protein [Acidomonas methanolica]MCQ9155279.1 hypothetical protein [Acidomonas methanolica]
MVAVYHFRVYDAANDEVRVPPAKSPKQRIDMVGGEIIEETIEEVPEAALDREGRYWPVKDRSDA